MSDIKFLVDIGSTFTKVLAIDLEQEKILTRVQVPSTVDRDVIIGLEEALNRVKEELSIQSVGKNEAIACSSAGGGLRMICIGFVPELTVEAATRAALGAGAKVVGIYSFELTSSEINEIEELSPDIILLSGGTDGGNKKVIIHNARLLASAPRIFCPIIIAGNKAVHDELRAIFEDSGKSIRFSKNVMPEIGLLDTDPCREIIKDVFVKNIIRAKGIEKAKILVKDVIMPTPVAVLNAARVLSDGDGEEKGLGELMLVDVGGATTDVCSIAAGNPRKSAVILRGLPEPYAKRTVEGDLGVRHNIDTLLKIGVERGLITNDKLKEMAGRFVSIDKLPNNEDEEAFDSALARTAVEVATERHAGRKDIVYGPMGEMQIQYGKDLTGIKVVIATGGPIVFAKDPKRILEAALFDKRNPNILKPERAEFYVDEDYILYGMGLLAISQPKKAMKLMKRYLCRK